MFCVHPVPWGVGFSALHQRYCCLPVRGVSRRAARVRHVLLSGLLSKRVPVKTSSGETIRPERTPDSGRTSPGLRSGDRTPEQVGRATWRPGCGSTRFARIFTTCRQSVSVVMTAWSDRGTGHCHSTPPGSGIKIEETVLVWIWHEISPRF